MVLCAAFSASSREAPSAMLLAAASVPSTIGAELNATLAAMACSRFAIASAAFCAE